MFGLSQKTGPLAAENAALKSQIESAKRRITELMLEKFQLTEEIRVLHEYRGGVEAPLPQPKVVIGRDVVIPSTPANSQIGLLVNRAAG